MFASNGRVNLSELSKSTINPRVATLQLQHSTSNREPIAHILLLQGEAAVPGCLASRPQGQYHQCHGRMLLIDPV